MMGSTDCISDCCQYLPLCFLVVCPQLLHPDEFEVVLGLPVPDYVQYTEVEGYGGLFYTLTLLRKSRSFPPALVLEDGKTMSPRNVMEEFWKHVDEFIKVFYSGEHVDQKQEELAVHIPWA